MRKSNGTDLRLYPSDPDLVCLCAAVEERFESLNLDYERIRGAMLLVPGELSGDVFLWNHLCNRYKRRDYRHRTGEKTALRNVAQWTLDVKRQLYMQPPIKLQWKD